MTKHETEPQYPEGFDPNRFADSLTYLSTLRTPGVISIGEEASLDEITELAESMKEMGVVGVYPLALHEVDEHNEVVRVAYFPVYYTEVISKVGGRRFNQPYPVTDDNVRWAEDYLATKLTGVSQDWTEERREDLIRSLALTKAFSDIRRRQRE